MSKQNENTTCTYAPAPEATSNIHSPGTVRAARKEAAESKVRDVARGNCVPVADFIPD